MFVFVCVYVCMCVCICVFLCVYMCACFDEAVVVSEVELIGELGDSVQVSGVRGLYTGIRTHTHIHIYLYRQTNRYLHILIYRHTDIGINA